MYKILVTGCAGFIGFHLCQRLLKEGNIVLGIDNINDYYDVNLKKDRLAIIQNQKKFSFFRLDISNKEDISDFFEKNDFDYVVNLAAQAGVRYSLLNPYAYIESNINGFLNILEGCRHHKIKHLVYASSSSVYGANKSMPFSVSDNVDHPVSLYAATKKSNELMAHSYSSLYNLPVTGLRFFTVYGPWGRPDMALFLFTKAITEGKTIDVYNYGKMRRDFTYIDDIVEGIYRVISTIPQPNNSWDGKNPDPAGSYAPYSLYNIGNHKPVELLYFIDLIEKNLSITAKKNMMPLQQGDVLETYADITNLSEAVGFKPVTSIEAGIEKFISWYKNYFLKNC